MKKNKIEDHEWSRKNDFLKNLYDEKLRHKEHRHLFVKQKMLYIASLFGLGLIKIKIQETTIETTLLLYLVPVVAMAYDVYILAEDYKVKRIGLFIRISRNIESNEGAGTCNEEINWEKWVSNFREPLAAFSSLFMSIFTSIAAFISIFNYDIFEKNLFLTIVWIVLCAMGLILITFKYYNIQRDSLDRALLDLSPIEIKCDPSEIFAPQRNQISETLKKELRRHYFPVPRYIKNIRTEFIFNFFKNEKHANNKSVEYKLVKYKLKEPENSIYRLNTPSGYSKEDKWNKTDIVLSEENKIEIINTKRLSEEIIDKIRNIEHIDENEELNLVFEKVKWIVKCEGKLSYEIEEIIYNNNDLQNDNPGKKVIIKRKFNRYLGF
ncbi:MAG: hypothetical protein L6Q97_07485 [Thermoanaerobaculia bacterium]|nr:hypothetical protein [Thermoanaerobaculia bacterium]